MDAARRRGIKRALAALALLLLLGLLAWLVRVVWWQAGEADPERPRDFDGPVETTGDHADGPGDADPKTRRHVRVPAPPQTPEASTADSSQQAGTPPTVTNRNPPDSATAATKGTSKRDSRDPRRLEVRPPDLPYRSGFGMHVAIDGGVAAVSAPLSDEKAGRGRVFVYEEKNDTWINTASLRSARSDETLVFGSAIDVSSGRVAVLDRAAEGDLRWVVRLFENDGVAWREAHEIPLPKQPEVALSLALDGDVLVVGTLTRSHVFRQAADGWHHAQALSTRNGRPFEGGARVAVSGDLIASATTEKGDGIHLFRRDGDAWLFEAEARPAKWKFKQFGESLAVGDGLLVAADEDLRQGIAVMARGSGGWDSEWRMGLSSGWKGRRSGRAGNGLAFDGDRIAAAMLRKRTGLLVARRDAKGAWQVGGVPLEEPRNEILRGATVAISGDTLLVGLANHKRGVAHFITLDPDFPVPVSEPEDEKRSASSN